MNRRHLTTRIKCLRCDEWADARVPAIYNLDGTPAQNPVLCDPCNNRLSREILARAIDARQKASGYRVTEGSGDDHGLFCVEHWDGECWKPYQDESWFLSLELATRRLHELKAVR